MFTQQGEGAFIVRHQEDFDATSTAAEGFNAISAFFHLSTPHQLMWVYVTGNYLNGS